MSKLYPTPAAFDRALKKAVRTAGGDLGEGYRQALRDRFLCRVFRSDNTAFVLKGGSGMLARIPDTRATRDLDFAASSRVSAKGALAEMKRIAALDLGDWCRFGLTRAEEMQDENGYSRLLKLRFATYIGAEEKDPILIDLSLDCSPTLPPERIKPANRVDVDGVETCDYYVYSLPDQMADKFCAIMERRPDGLPSSRMKDLVDVVACATKRDFECRQLAVAIANECAKRGMEVPDVFEAPLEWKSGFSAFAAKCGIASVYRTLKEATSLATSFFGPAIEEGATKEATWDHISCRWIVADGR